MEDSSNYKILIVDDQESDLLLLEEILKSHGYEVLKAMSGAQCLNKLESNNDIDLILLDINMPEMNGLEVCKIIKSTDNLKHIPIIFETAVNDEVNQMKGFLFGAVDYITKPYSPSILYARVKNHIDLKVTRDKMFSLLEKQEQLIENLNRARANKKRNLDPSLDIEKHK